jgi:uridine phosphorylase
MSALKRTNIYLDEDYTAALEVLGKRKGLKVAQMLRLIISEYVEREQQQAAEKKKESQQK